MLSTMNNTLDNAFDFLASFQDYISSFESFESDIKEAEDKQKAL